jgi:ubiquitin-like modifier-activating enzyme ATG7
MSSSSEHSPLRFVGVSSLIDSSFWPVLSSKKLSEWKLDESPRPLVGLRPPSSSPGVASGLILGQTALADAASGAPGGPGAVHGELRNTNTLEGFRGVDKQALCDEVGARVWRAIASGEAEARPHLLTPFVLLAHADIKKWKYYYWACFPTAFFAGPNQPAVTAGSAQRAVEEVFGGEGAAALLSAVATLGDFFLARAGPGAGTGGAVETAPLSSWKEWSEAAAAPVICFSDPSPLEGSPSGAVRNLLLLAAVRWGLRRVTLVCLRRLPGSGIVLDVTLPAPPDSASSQPSFSGWELNAKGKPGHRLVDLGSSMDPVRVAEDSVDLNLRLMKWRLLPSLDTELIGRQRCLLLGAGTLGCNVARTLMAWGVRKITLVDNGKVSFSNPVRQSLFTFEDCLNGGRPKAVAAAQRLKEIFPSMEAEGHDLSIPMAGHAVESEQQRADVERDVARLEQLFVDHDLVFLLTDSRESRWLPTVLGQVHCKPVINAAMAFDSYLVMRHRVPRPEAGPDSEGAPAPPHGCYFCSDVIAPVDSMSNRSLDQQCTVTRPGLSYITSAMAVELAVALLHHPLGFRAPSSDPVPTSEGTPQPLGLVPQQIRGFLTHLHTYLGQIQRSKNCTACSDPVLAEYKRSRAAFFIKASNTPSYLEDLSGLTALHVEAEKALQAMDDEGGGSEDDF